MAQPRLISLVEAVANVAVGFCVSLIVWTWIIVPVWELDVSMGDNLAITTVFTVLSIARGYIVRRFFEVKLHRLAIWVTGNLFSRY